MTTVQDGFKKTINILCNDSKHNNQHYAIQRNITHHNNTWYTDIERTNEQHNSKMSSAVCTCA